MSKRRKVVTVGLPQAKQNKPLNEIVDSGRALKYVPSWNLTLYLLAL